MYLCMYYYILLLLYIFFSEFTSDNFDLPALPKIGCNGHLLLLSCISACQHTFRITCICQFHKAGVCWLFFFFLFLIVWVILRGEGGNAQFPSYFETGDFKKDLKI